MSWSLQAAGKGDALAAEIKRQSDELKKLSNNNNANAHSAIDRATLAITAAIQVSPNVGLKVSASGSFSTSDTFYHNFNASVETLWGGLHV